MKSLYVSDVPFHCALVYIPLYIAVCFLPPMCPCLTRAVSLPSPYVSVIFICQCPGFRSIPVTNTSARLLSDVSLLGFVSLMSVWVAVVFLYP
ncbi:hypothetical protein FKM82_030983 [Ascaphus truei]